MIQISKQHLTLFTLLYESPCLFPCTCWPSSWPWIHRQPSLVVGRLLHLLYRILRVFVSCRHCRRWSLRRRIASCRLLLWSSGRVVLSTTSRSEMTVFYLRWQLRDVRWAGSISDCASAATVGTRAGRIQLLSKATLFQVESLSELSAHHEPTCHHLKRMHDFL